MPRCHGTDRWEAEGGRSRNGAAQSPRHATQRAALTEPRVRARPTPPSLPAALLRASQLGLAPPAATAVVLPLRPDLSGGGAPALRRRVADLRPTLLLFLRRLRCLAITDAASATAASTTGGAAARAASASNSGAGHSSAGGAGSQLMVRREAGPGLVELRCGPGGRESGRWLVVSDTFKPRLPRLGVAVDETTVSLAFSLDDGAAPGQQPVFAFLPLRRYGLRFMVQGDWVAPAARESIQADDEW